MARKLLKCSECGKRIELAAGPAAKHRVEQGAVNAGLGSGRVFHPSCMTRRREREAEENARIVRRAQSDDAASRRRERAKRAQRSPTEVLGLKLKPPPRQLELGQGTAAAIVALGPEALDDVQRELQKRGRSGPNIPEMDRRTVAVKLRLPRDVADELRDLAELSGNTLSGIVADLVRHNHGVAARNDRDAEKKTPR